MGNTPLKRSRISYHLLPGKSESKMMDKLILPDIDIIYFKSFQYRAKAWRVEGYNPSKPSPKKQECRLNINGFKAWKIGFRNKHQTAINITLHFRIQGMYVPGYDYTKTYNNLLPNEEADIVVVPGLKLASVRLDKVEVFVGTTLLSSTKVGSFMPYTRGRFSFSFLIASFLGLNFLFIASNNMRIPKEHNATTLVYILTFYLAFWEAFNITPVIIMFLLLFVGPFILHDPVQRISLLVLGCFYLWAVWRKRSSIKDFLIGAFIP